MSVVLRRMTAADVDASIALLKAHDPAQSESEWVARLGRDILDADKHPVVAVVDREVVGYARTLPFEPDGDSPVCAAPAGYYLLGLVVAGAYRRRGIGRMLTEERLRWLVSRGTTAVYFYTDRGNTASRRLHEQFGFRPLTDAFWFPALPPQHSQILYGLVLAQA